MPNVIPYIRDYTLFFFPHEIETRRVSVMKGQTAVMTGRNTTEKHHMQIYPLYWQRWVKQRPCRDWQKHTERNTHTSHAHTCSVPHVCVALGNFYHHTHYHSDEQQGGEAVVGDKKRGRDREGRNKLQTYVWLSSSTRLFLPPPHLLAETISPPILSRP